MQQNQKINWDNFKKIFLNQVEEEFDKLKDSKEGSKEKIEVRD